MKVLQPEERFSQADLFRFVRHEDDAFITLGGGKLIRLSQTQLFNIIPIAWEGVTYVLTEEERHTMLYLYRQRLEGNTYPPLSHHRWMFDGLPTVPYLAPK